MLDDFQWRRYNNK